MDKKTIKWTIIMTIIFAVIMLFLFNIDTENKPILDNNTNNGGEVARLPQCSDGIDNDGDGLIDYPDDPNCSSLLDDNESPPKNITSILYFLIISGIIGGGIYLYLNRKPITENSDILFKPIPKDRAYELMISWFLTTKAINIATINETEDDGYVLRRTYKQGDIIETDRMEDNDSKSNEKFLYSWIQVMNAGIWNGCHLLSCSLQRGDKAIKQGDIRFERDEYKQIWEKRTRTYNPSSLTDRKDRMMMLQMDALEEGDDAKLNFLTKQMQVNESNNVAEQKKDKTPSPYEDLDDNEYKQILSQNMANNHANNKKKMARKKYKHHQQTNPIDNESY